MINLFSIWELIIKKIDSVAHDMPHLKKKLEAQKHYGLFSWLIQ